MENIINDTAESLTGKSLKDHKWSFPLAVALKATGSVLNGISNIGGIPVVGIVGSALQMGSSLFEKDIHDYHKETESRFDDMDEAIKTSNDLTNQGLKNLSVSMNSSMNDILRHTMSIEARLVQGTVNILESTDKIQQNLNLHFSQVKHQLNEINPKIEELKDTTHAILDLLTDSQYRSGIERVEAAFDTLMDMADNDLNEAIELLKNFMFELKTDMRQHLRNEKLVKYLSHILNEKGPEAAKQMFSYIVTVRGKYLLIMTVYSVYLSKFEAVESEFKSFNKDVETLTDEFFSLCPSQFVIENSIRVCGYLYSKSYRIKSCKMMWPKTGETLSLKEALEKDVITSSFYNDQIKKVNSFLPLRF